MVAAVLMILVIAAAVYVVPKYGAVFSTYTEQKSLYNAARTGFERTQGDKEELDKHLAALKTATEETDKTREEVFKLAAQLEQDILDGKTDRKICYITIDDGPYNRGNEYLKLFNKYDIKATFFLTTANGNKLPDQGDITAESQYPEYLKYGHTIGNHSYSHNYSSTGIYKNAKSFLKDIEKQQDFTANATGGYRPQIIRFPGGTSMAGSQLGEYEKALREKGYGWIDWTVDSGDSSGSDKLSEASIKKTVLNAAKSKDQKIMVVLFHEWSQKSLDALPEIIEGLQEKGYVFLPLFYDSVMVSK